MTKKHMHDIIIKFCKEDYELNIYDIKICIVRSKLEALELEIVLGKIIATYPLSDDHSCSHYKIKDFWNDVIKVAESQGILKIPLRDFEIADIYY